MDRMRGKAADGNRHQRTKPPVLMPRGLHPSWRRIEIGISLAVLLIAGLSHLTGAPTLVSIPLLILGGVGLGVACRAAKVERNLFNTLLKKEALSREELETLADRIWELRESEERFHGLVDALGDLIVHRDREGRILYANKVFADLLGQDQASLPGKTLNQLGIDISMVPDTAFANDEYLSSTDAAIHTPEGMRWYSWTEHSVRDEKSGAVSHRAIARDITARKRAEMALINARERAEQASLAKSSFLATVSHEIRTPMNGILGMATLLADTKLTAEQRTYVGAVSTSASALVALIEDLLDYSKIEAGRMELEPQPMSVHELVENVVELLAARAFGKNIGLGCHIAPDVPAQIEADPGRLRQTLINLVGNAIKFTDAGGVLVHVSMDEKNGAPALRVAITDTGPGLEKADIERIFENFEQVDSSSTRKHGGAGLGLAITKRIVDAMEGVIAVASTPGEGSEFSVLLPLRGETQGAEETKHAALQDLRVLVLSPYAEEAEAIAMTVVSHGGKAEVAGDVAGAVRAAQDAGQSFDAVLIDAALENDAGQFLQRLRKAGIDAVRVLTLIAPSERGRLAALRANGYAAFLARPVRGKSLIRQLPGGKPEAMGHAVQTAAAGEDDAGKPGTASPSMPSFKVLVAEDNEINAMLARAALSKAGHAVKLVSNGRDAVDALADGAHYDMVLMDLHMPVMDGLDAIDAIRRREEEKGLAPVPILVLTADGQETTRQEVLSHGANGFVTKPLDPGKLLAALEMQMAV